MEAPSQIRCACLVLFLVLSGLIIIVLTSPFGCIALANDVIRVDQVIQSSHGIVVAAHSEAARIGAEILQRGGSAMDAAVAIAFALAVVEPEASGLGGGGFLLLYDATTRQSVAMNYRETAPFAATPTMYSLRGPGLPGLWDGPSDEAAQTTLRKIGGGAVAVPRMVAGLIEAHKQYGQLPLADVIEPAIQLAEDGFPVSENLYRTILNTYDILLSNDAMAAAFLNDWLPYEPGEMMCRPDLARMFRLIVEDGAEAFYRGEIAEAIVRAVTAAGGLLSLDDLSSVTVAVEPALNTTYRGRSLVGLPVPAGATPVFETLHILEGIDLSAMDPGCADASHWIVEATKLAFADRGAYLGDPAFCEVPLDYLLSLEWATRQRARIDPETALLHPEPLEDESESTTHVSVIDANGNMVSLTQSINFFFGARVFVPEAGILMNNTMADFDPEPGGPNSIAPGKIPMSSMSPLFVFGEDGPQYILGTPGGTRITSTLVQLIVDLIDWQLPLYEAIDAPRFHSQDATIYTESRFPESWVNTLRDRGHPIETRGAFDLYFGGAHAIQIIEVEGASLYLGVADPRRSGQAAGY